MISGSIDSVTVVNGVYRLMGWSCVNMVGAQFPVEDIGLSGKESVDCGFFSRPDISAEPNYFGVYWNISSLDQLLAIYLGLTNCVVSYGSESYYLPLWDKLKSKIKKEIIKSLIDSQDENELNETTRHLIGVVRQGERFSSVSDDLACSSFSLAVGFRSFDNTVVVGRSGYLFLFGGANSVDDIYSREREGSLASAWIDLVKLRKSICNDVGVEFFQIIVPEKQTVLREYYHREIEAPSRALREISSYFSGNSSYIDAFEILSKSCLENGFSSYRRVDTHFSFHGAESITRYFLKKLSAKDIFISQPKFVVKKISGDLGSKLGFGEFYEDCFFPDIKDWDFSNKPINLIDKFDPPSGHVGSYRIWTNFEPLVDKVILVFGNSICERGGTPFGLSWWFSRIFRKTIFFWSPSFDQDLVLFHKPDVVVCQTVERFLPVIPKS